MRDTRVAMRIHDLTESTDGDRFEVSATVTWEDSERPAQKLHFATHRDHADDLAPNPNAFLLAAAVPAMQYGERRVSVEGAVCPQLRNGLVTAMQVLRIWYGDPAPHVMAIEATEGFRPSTMPEARGAGSFMSGGVDALATFRANRLDFPVGHPRSIGHCFFVHGFDVGGYAALDKSFGHFDLAVSTLSALLEREGARLVPVYTNLRHLEAADPLAYDPQLTELGIHGQLFTMASHGASLAAVGHAFSRRISTALIASSESIPALQPLGSHPLLDPSYSSSELWIQHDGARFERLEKVRLVAGWDAALRTLRTCFYPLRSADVLNCGKCEKCLRTMAELLVVGRLHDCPTFPLDDLAPRDLETIAVSYASGDPPTTAFLYDVSEPYWRDLVEPFRRIGRADLADVIDAKLAAYGAAKRSRLRRNAIKRFDRRYLGGMLAGLRGLGRRRRISA
jgi:hypothetical protein